MNVLSEPEAATVIWLEPRTFSNVAEIVASPEPTAVTRPALTVATEVAEESQTASAVTFRAWPFENDAVAENCDRPPRVGVGPITDTLVTVGADGAGGLELPHAAESEMAANAATTASSFTSLAYDPACSFSNARYPFRSEAASGRALVRGAPFLHFPMWTRRRVPLRPWIRGAYANAIERNGTGAGDAALDQHSVGAAETRR